MNKIRSSYSGVANTELPLEVVSIALSGLCVPAGTQFPSTVSCAQCARFTLTLVFVVVVVVYLIQSIPASGLVCDPRLFRG